MIQRAELELTGKSVKVFKMTRAYECKKNKARGLFKGVEVTFFLEVCVWE